MFAGSSQLPMKLKHYASLFLINLIVLLGIASLQPVPGYMDAEYYYAGAIRLYEGYGFTEEMLWNYLDDPSGLPHPSHTYWMPLVSILGVVGMKIAGAGSYLAARLIPFIIALWLPLVVTAWSIRIHPDPKLAYLSGLLAIFSAFYLPYLTHTDSFGLVMAFGLLFFIFIQQIEKRKQEIWIVFFSLGLGFVSGLMHLSRADGILWLLVSLIYLIWHSREQVNEATSHLVGKTLAAAIFGYLMVMGPWFWRNYQLFGSLLAPGNFQALWLTTYNELYRYPADSLSMQHWLASGWANILTERLKALASNLQTMLAVQGEVFLFPFILLGLWFLRREKFIQLAVILWALLLIIMTVIFPFAGARGGFFHSAAALQPVFWLVAPIGLDRTLDWVARKRNWNREQAGRVFQPALVGLALLLSLLVILGNPSHQRAGLGDWGSTHSEYVQVEQALQETGADPRDIVMVNNPPGYYLAARRPAVSIPFGDVEIVLDVARRYQVKYLLLEFNQLQGEENIYENPHSSTQLKYLVKIGHVQIYEFFPDKVETP